jgi:hypothetical protein
MIASNAVVFQSLMDHRLGQLKQQHRNSEVARFLRGTAVIHKGDRQALTVLAERLLDDEAAAITARHRTN